MNERQTLEELMRSFRFHKNPILNWVFGEVNYYSHIFLNGKFKIKNTFQKLIRGYSDSDCWNLPQATAKFILPRIKHLRKNFNTLSNRHHLIVDGKVISYIYDEKNLEYSETEKDFVDTTINKSISLSKEEYENVLDEIIFALQMIVDEENPKISLEELYEVYPKGFDPIKDNKMFLTKQKDDNYSVEFEAKDNIQPDYSKLNKAYERQRNGFLLLGLYFRDLWD
jgi:hypothetical protein